LPSKVQTRTDSEAREDSEEEEEEGTGLNKPPPTPPLYSIHMNTNKPSSSSSLLLPPPPQAPAGRWRARCRFGLWSVFVPPSSLGPAGYRISRDYSEGEPWFP